MGPPNKKTTYEDSSLMSISFVFLLGLQGSLILAEQDGAFLAGRHSAPLPDNLARRPRSGTLNSLASTEVIPPSTVKSSPAPKLLDPDYDFDAQVPEGYGDTPSPSPRQLFKGPGSTDELAEPMGSDGVKSRPKRRAESVTTPSPKGGESVDESHTKRPKKSPSSETYDKYYHQSLALIMILSYFILMLSTPPFGLKYQHLKNPVS